MLSEILYFPTFLKAKLAILPNFYFQFLGEDIYKTQEYKNENELLKQKIKELEDENLMLK